MSEQSKPLVVTHAFCVDGFMARTIFHKKYGEEVEFVDGVYGNPDLPDVTGRDVYLVDFSYKRPVVLDMLEKANSVTILDHHKSAYEDIGDLIEEGKLLGVFDMERSGAMIAWDWCFPNENAPRIVAYVQDRDLWNNELPYSEFVASFMFSQPLELEVFQKILEDNDIAEYVAKGEAVHQFKMKSIRECIDKMGRTMKIAGEEVPCVNLPHVFASDAAGILCESNPDKPFAVCYSEGPNGRSFSLRSRGEGGADVSKIASSYGGGGHRNAAGFELPWKKAHEVEVFW